MRSGGIKNFIGRTALAIKLIYSCRLKTVKKIKVVDRFTSKMVPKRYFVLIHVKQLLNRMIGSKVDELKSHSLFELLTSSPFHIHSDILIT